MRVFILILCLSVAFGEKDKVADTCNDTCKEGCRCSSKESPIPLDKTPQLISLTFDEAIVAELWTKYWDKILDRTNPDDILVGATFFIPHEYTEYDLVTDLYNFGYEIGIHSITKNTDQDYWKYGDLETLKKEFGGERHIISKFANIPKEDLIGVRTPQLKLNGNISIRAFIDSELKYDSSWPTQSPLFPYTLDFKTTQACEEQSSCVTCPNEQFKGFWILPIVDLNNGKPCNNLADCNLNGTAKEIKTWLNDQLAEIKKTKVPLTLRIASYWFEQSPNALEGFTSWLDGLKEDKEVFLVTQKQVYEWIKNPVDIENFKTDDLARDRFCQPVECSFIDEYGQDRYMKSCVECPPSYPWIGNPDGK